SRTSILCFFFFSSRRRHTRSKRDWSSDVCSSDLTSTFVGAPDLQDTVWPWCLQQKFNMPPPPSNPLSLMPGLPHDGCGSNTPGSSDWWVDGYGVCWLPWACLVLSYSS